VLAGVNLKTYRSSDEQFHAISYIISQLRSDVRFSTVPIVMMVESVACQTASHVHSYIRSARLPDVFMMMERSPDANGQWREGCPKDKEITYNMALSLTRMLSIGYLVLSDKIFTYNKNPEKSAEKELEKLRQMMVNFRRVYKKFTTVQADRGYHITAKTDSGAQDDLLIALCMCLYWREVFWQNKVKYRAEQARIRQQKGMDIDFPL
jgi:hypothetical protein